jgi:predicted Fe-Mo cluster-binding NifX family protein
MEPAGEQLRSHDGPARCVSPSDSRCAACRGQVVYGSLVATIVGLLLKGAIGFLCGSRAVFADAVHSFADAVSFGVNCSDAGRGGQQRSFGRTVVIGSVIFASGIWVCADSTATLICGTVSHPGLWAVVVAVVSAVVNFHLFKVSECVNARAGDSSTFVCVVQNKTNFFASCISLLGVVLAELGLTYFDPICALVIGSLLIAAAATVLRDAFAQLPSGAESARRFARLSMGLPACLIVGWFAWRVHDALAGRNVVLIPARGTMASSPVDDVLGRAAYFVVVDVKNGAVTSFLNNGRYLEGDVSGSVLALVKASRVEVVLARSIGREMFADLQNAGVKMYYFEGPQTVGQVLSEFRHDRLDLARAPNVSRGHGLAEVRWLQPW